MINPSGLLCLLLTVAMSPLALAKGEPPSVHIACVSCHGESGEGNPVIPVPPIAGQRAEYLRTQLLAFRSGYRGDHPADTWGRQMALMAKPLTDSDIDQLALFLAEQPRWEQAEQPQVLEDTDKRACMGCHDAASTSAESTTPIIAGMPEAYLYRQLVHYRDGIRSASIDGAPNPMSAFITTDMTDLMLQELARFFSDL